MLNNILNIQSKFSKSSTLFKASTWVLVGYIFSQLLRFSSNLILTRLLVPEMFGIMAVVHIIVTAIVMFSDIGIAQSIIQNEKGEQTSFLNTAWSIQVIRGVVIWAVICAIALALFIFNTTDAAIGNTSVYAEPLLPWILIAVSFSAVITGFNSTAIHQVNRNLNMGRWTLVTTFSQLSGILVMITIAVLHKSIWALVIGTLVSSLIEMILSHKSLPGIKNTFHFDKVAFKEIIKFGKWIFLSTAIGFIANQGDRIILGGLFTANFLGIYTIAFMLSNLPSQMISTFSHKILFPKFSAVNRDTPNELKKILSKSRFWLNIVVLTSIGIVMPLSQTLVNILYDQRYSEAGWILEILFIRVAIGCILIPGSITLMAKGLPQYATVAAVINAIFVIVCLPFTYQLYGTYGVVIAIAISGFLSVPVIWYGLINHRLFDYRIEAMAIFLLCTSYLLGTIFDKFLKGGF
jgi:O-antigen/teichoic acid export membrane protein